MDNERYKAWLHRRVEKSDQSLAKHGLTKKSDPQGKPLLDAVRINRALHAALDYLLEESQRRQILLFTCQKREMAYLQGKENVTVTKL